MSGASFLKSIVFFMAIASGMASAIDINSYSLMPSDKTTLFASPFLEPATLADYGISREVWDDNLHGWRPDAFAYRSGATGFFNENFDSLIAPHGNSINDPASRFTFDNPVYAVGFTLVATNFPNFNNPSDSFDDNYENVSYHVVAYDLSGNIIGDNESSSYGKILGPVEYFTNFRGTEIMFSYAGLWLDEPIHELTVSASRPGYDQAIMATIASFSFSSSPAISIPEPSTLSMVALILVGIYPRVRRNKVNSV